MSTPVVFQAIVLKSQETGSSSEVIHTVSAEYGRLSVYGKGILNPKNKFRGILQPLALVELTLYLKDGADMGTLRDASLIEDHAPLTADLERFSLALLLAEAASFGCEPGQPAPGIFAALVEGLHYLDARSGLTAPQAAARGLLHILSAAGYEPQIDEALLGPWPAGETKPLVFWLDASTGVISARGHQPAGAPQWPWILPGAAFPLPPKAVRYLYESRTGAPAVSLSTDEMRQWLEALIRLCEWHHEGALRSADFWRRIDRPG
ncbi:hypothetical protein BH09SUM1_BH09SUM1_15760 [soil metagenome]